MKLKKVLRFLLWAILVYFILDNLISAWPLLVIGLIIFLLLRHLKSGKSLPGFVLMMSAVLFAISIGELILRVKGDHLCYPERIAGPFYHIVVTKYESPFTAEEQGWLHIQGQHRFVPSQRPINNEGLYDVNHSLTKTKKHRVVVLGDSFTEGTGSTQDSTYVHLLQNDTVEAINAGMSGSDPAFELRLLEMRMFRYDPDIVIMSVNESDIYDFMIRGGMERFLPDTTVQFKKRPWWEPCYGCSFIVRSLVCDVFKLDWAFMTPQQAVQAKALALQQLAGVIETANRECVDRKIRFIVNFHPIASEICKSYMECAPLMNAVQNNGVEVVNMLEYFSKHGVDCAHTSQYYWQVDGHNNNRGYAMMAEGLTAHILKASSVR